jgi:hypothetical protein
MCPQHDCGQKSSCPDSPYAPEGEDVSREFPVNLLIVGELAWRYVQRVQQAENDVQKKVFGRGRGKPLKGRIQEQRRVGVVDCRAGEEAVSDQREVHRRRRGGVAATQPETIHQQPLTQAKSDLERAREALRAEDRFAENEVKRALSVQVCRLLRGERRALSDKSRLIGEELVNLDAISHRLKSALAEADPAAAPLTMCPSWPQTLLDVQLLGFPEVVRISRRPAFQTYQLSGRPLETITEGEEDEVVVDKDTKTGSESEDDSITENWNQESEVKLATAQPVARGDYHPKSRPPTKDLLLDPDHVLEIGQFTFSAFHSPHSFYVRLKERGFEYTAMKERISEASLLPARSVIPKRRYIVRQGCSLERCRVLHLIGEGGIVDIFLEDEGCDAQVPASQLMELPDEGDPDSLVHLPAFAVRCKVRNSLN